ncbi:PaaI family thioesterase [Xenophilus arseniciresistens]|uniref:PaaI family thioesterase n=1 Tax=Xenophilus arseniciresistens TaxID=1283306 RepID=A0AAE3N6P7_9BURK|nr:PaaI family thioesterase [Xenophilus arseniciresistens]MDA7414942.1 PaaI family thioesterase [Xenophilus arseniciresistens]
MSDTPSSTPSTSSAPSSSELAQWLADEAAVLARLEAGPGPGLAAPAQLAGKTGLEVMQAMIDGQLPYAEIARTLDFTIVEVAPGRAVFQGTPLQRHLNPLGSVHGGWFATLLDSALGCAIHTLMPPGRGYTTAELGVNMVRAIHPAKVSRVRAIGTVIHCGRQLATAEARLVGPDGTLYAHATTTCLVFDLPAAR